MKALAGFAGTAAAAAAAAAWLGACSSPLTKRPAELGDCIPVGDAACSSPTLTGGGNPGIPDSSTAAQDSGAMVTPTGCGGADGRVVTMNGYCVPCITSLCCQADQGCGPTCQSVIDCTNKCALGDLVCVGGCENDPLLQAGVAAYLDLGSCMAANCPACPILPHQ
jgi:hypothetical protein